jgi:hypothetical protein
MDFFFNFSVQQLNSSLFSAVGQASAARTVQVAAIGRNGGPAGPEQLSDQARLEARAREATRVLQGFTKLTVKQKRAVATLEKANERLGEMKALLLEARELIVKAQDAGATPEEQRDYANAFDQLIGQYNLKVKGAGHFGTNLLGSNIRDIFEANDLDVPRKPGSLANVTYQGNYLGTDYVLKDGSGNVYLPNLFGSSVVEFPPSNPDDTGFLLQNDDTVTYDSSTGAFSITRSGDASPSLSGTLERKGVGVLHSYFYGEFKDATLRDEALADVEAALGELRFNISVFEANQTRAEVALKFSQDQIETNKGVAASLEADKFAAERRFQLEEQKRQILFESALTNSLSYGTTGLSGMLQDALFNFEV